MNIKTPWTQDIEACKKGGQLLSLHELETKADAYRQGFQAALESEEVKALADAAQQGLRALQDHVPLHHVTRELLANALAALERLRKEAQE